MAIILEYAFLLTCSVGWFSISNCACMQVLLTGLEQTNSTCRNRDGYCCGDKSAFLSVYIFMYFVSQLYKIAAQVSSTLHGAADNRIEHNV